MFCAPPLPGDSSAGPGRGTKFLLVYRVDEWMCRVDTKMTYLLRNRLRDRRRVPKSPCWVLQVQKTGNKAGRPSSSQPLPWAPGILGLSHEYTHSTSHRRTYRDTNTRTARRRALHADTHSGSREKLCTLSSTRSVAARSCLLLQDFLSRKKKTGGPQGISQILPGCLAQEGSSRLQGGAVRSRRGGASPEKAGLGREAGGAAQRLLYVFQATQQVHVPQHSA